MELASVAPRGSNVQVFCGLMPSWLTRSFPGFPTLTKSKRTSTHIPAFYFRKPESPTNAVVPGVLNSHYMTYSARELKKQLIRYQLLAPNAARKSRPDAACLLLGRYRRKLRWPLSRQLCGQICGWSHSRSSSDANFGAGRSTCRSTHLELVEVLPKRRDLLLLALALADGQAENVQLRVGRHRVAALHRLPVAEGALREGLAGRSLAEGAGETEGFRNGQVRPHLHQVRTRALLLLEDDSAALVHAVIDPALGIHRCGDVDKEDRLLQRRGGGHLAGEDGAARRRHDLPGAAVDRVRVHRHILDVVAGRTHRLLADRPLLGRPLERRDDVLLDLVQELNSHRGVDDDVRTLRLRPEAPDLERVVLVPVILLGKLLGPVLNVMLGAELAGVDVVRVLVPERAALHPQAVVLVRRLRQTHLARGRRNGLAVGHDRVTGDEVALRVIVLQVLEADFHVQLTAACNDVLARLAHLADHKRVGFCHLLEPLHEFRQIAAILGLHSNAHDRRHRVLHILDVVGVLVVRDGRRLENKLINANETTGVPCRHTLHLLDIPAHDKNDTLDGLHVETLLGARLRVVERTLDPYLLACRASAGEDAAESVEPALVRRRNHLGDVHHQRTVDIASSNTLCTLIVMRDPYLL